MSISFSTVFYDLWQFIKRPTLEHLSTYWKENPIPVLSFLLLIDFLLMIPLSAFLGLLGIEDMDHKIETLSDDPLMLAVMAVGVAPVIEEAIFRLPMKYSYVRIGIATGLVLLLLATVVESELVIGTITATVLFSIFLFQFFNERQGNAFNEQLEPLWLSHFYLPFWFFTTAFAFLHLTNFGAAFPLYLAPFLVLPQFVLGIILGYVRTGYGFIYAVLFHALHNGILVGLATLAENAPS